ncbi:uncharacterized protein H6S33_000991 [Morchella sextelata]|uniref:uncharacterized protein n=1 Tax=Morchella sextelata TaxID=1174677 RepID=UPI001D03B6B4|nr:uncharacterized protein H6S33_000991 [Morchella sextelata]KAH0615355.1 hypothetical protein H6S33_000991 [Morchella sextelata]
MASTSSASPLLPAAHAQDSLASKSPAQYGSVPAAPRTRPSFLRSLSPSHLGLCMLLASQVLTSVQATVTRYLAISLPAGRHYHAFEVLFARMSITLIGCLVWMWWNKVPHAPFGRRDLWPLLIARGCGGLVGVYGLYTSLSYLPMPDAVVLTFLAPFVVGYACSKIPSLHEPFTLREKLGGLVSLAGVTLIARPSFLFPVPHDHMAPSSAIPPPEITPAQRLYAVSIGLVGVLGAATAYTTIRWIGARAHPLISVAYFSGLVTVVSVVVLVAVPSTGGFVVPQGRLEWGLLGGIGVSGFAMQYLLTRGWQLVKGARAGMIVYTQMVFAVVGEWLVWGGVPDWQSCVGGAMVVGSAVVVAFWKEKEGKGAGKKAEEEEQVVVVVVDEETGLLAEDE